MTKNDGNINEGIREDAFVRTEAQDLSEPKEKGKAGIFKKYKVRDVVFIVLASVAMLVTCMAMPFLNSVQIYGIGLLGIAFQVSFFQAVILCKVKKPGASFFSAMILGLFHVVFAPHMILFCFVSGLLSEAIGLLAFRSYRNPLAIALTSSLLPPFITLCLTGWSFLLMGVDGAMGHLHLTGAGIWIPVGVALGVLALSLFGATCGILLMRTLLRKGVIHESL